MPGLPPHISPEHPAAAQESHDDNPVPHLSLADQGFTPGDERDDPTNELAAKPPPPDLISPAITPPLTPSGSLTPREQRPPTSIPVARSSSTPCALLPTLPEVQCLVRARIPTVSGSEMFLHLYSNNVDNKEHLAIVFGSHIRSKTLFAHYPGETERDRLIRGAYDGRLHVGRTQSKLAERSQRQQEQPQKLEVVKQPAEGAGNAASSSSPSPSKTQQEQALLPLVRIHSECYTGETAWSARCDCGEQLDEAARLMSLPSQSAAGGVIVYLRQEGRGIGLGEKLKAYNLQDLGSDTVEANLLLRHPADARSYGLATAILQDLGLGSDSQEGGEGVVKTSGGIRLLTNNPDKVAAVEGPNREIVVKERVAMVPLAWKKGGQGIQSKEIEQYLRTKIGKMGHMLDNPV